MPLGMSGNLRSAQALTGAVLGALLVPCNVYSGLKIGWSFNMSIAAALLSCGFWETARRVAGERRVTHWGLLENNINQTCASSAASIISAGLVAPIPALTILTGQTLSWPVLSAWLFAVSFIGVLVGLALRRQMLEVQQLPFPSGVATAETVREIYARGSEAASRVKHLLAAALVAGGTKFFSEFLIAIPMLGPAVGLRALRTADVEPAQLGVCARSVVSDDRLRSDRGHSGWLVDVAGSRHRLGIHRTLAVCLGPLAGAYRCYGRRCSPTRSNSCSGPAWQ